MERSAELEELTRKLYDAVSSADIAFFECYVSRADGIVVTGTAPQEWWESRGELLQAMRAQMEAVGKAAKLIAGDVRAHRHGDVGWVADRPKLRMGSVDVACRHTSVFVREDGEWRIVQHHFSVGVANEDIFGVEAARLG